MRPGTHVDPNVKVITPEQQRVLKFFVANRGDQFKVDDVVKALHYTGTKATGTVSKLISHLVGMDLIQTNERDVKTKNKHTGTWKTNEAWLYWVDAVGFNYDKSLYASQAEPRSRTRKGEYPLFEITEPNGKFHREGDWPKRPIDQVIEMTIAKQGKYNSKESYIYVRVPDNWQLKPVKATLELQ